MRALIRFIQRHASLLLFLLLETIAVVMLASKSYYQRSGIVQVNRRISGLLYSKVDGTREYLSLKMVNKGLVEENAALRNQLEQYKSLTDSAVVGSGNILDLHYSYVPARVIRNSVYKQYNYLTLDRGKEQGVFRDMGVISSEGLVGIVLESGRQFSTVIPILNRDFRLSARISRNGYAGILQWDGLSARQAQLHEIPFHVELNKGDTVTTSSYSAIFPEGIVIGTIESFELDKGNFYDIQVKLSTDFQHLYNLEVVRNHRQEEQREIESRHR